MTQAFFFPPVYTCASYTAGRRCLLMYKARSSSAIVYAHREAVAFRCELMTLEAFLFFPFSFFLGLRQNLNVNHHQLSKTRQGHRHRGGGRPCVMTQLIHIT